jgi:hypothetical protein
MSSARDSTVKLIPHYSNPFCYRTTEEMLMGLRIGGEERFYYPN